MPLGKFLSFSSALPDGPFGYGSLKKECQRLHLSTPDDITTPAVGELLKLCSYLAAPCLEEAQCNVCKNK